MNSRHNHPGPRFGFSLLEMLVVLIIIGLLAALVGPRLMDNIGKSKVKTTRAQIELLASSVERFYLDVGRYPRAEEGLRVLLEAPSTDTEKWDGPYLEKSVIPSDGWGRAFEYRTDHETYPYVIVSLGADGKPGGDEENADLDNRSGA